MRHHHKTIMELRHGHEEPLWDLTKRFMKLRLAMRHQPSWNYVLNHTKIMHHQPNIELSCIPILCQYTTNHPTMFHMHIMPSPSIPDPNISYRTYKASYLNYLKQSIIWSCETYMYPTNLVNLAQPKELLLRQEGSLAQATNSRLSETAYRRHVEVSLKLAHLA